MARNDSSWLVRSSGRILGPFPTEKVCELLTAREISMLDEASTPGRRYQPLQYLEDFRDVIEGMRKAVMSEHTEATWSQQTALTQTLTDVDGGTMTEELSDSGFTNVRGAKEIVVNEIDEVASSVPTVHPAGRFQTAHAQTSAVQRQVDKATRGLWIVTAVILTLAAAFILRKRLQPSSDLRGGSPSSKQNIAGLLQIGHYNDALREMKQAYGDSAQATDFSIYYATLLVQMDGQTSLGRRLFSGVLAARRPEVKQAYTGLGLADLMDGQTDQAAESLDRALALDPDYVPAILNLANVHLKRGNYDKAKDFAERALRLNPQQGEAVLVLAEATLFAHKASPNPAALQSMAQRLHEAVRRRWDFASELGYYGLYYDHMLRDPALDQRLTDYLDKDPSLTADHRHNLLIYRGRVQWSVLARGCEQLVAQMGPAARVATLQASCFAHEGKWDAARTAIERAVHQEPHDPLIQAWYSYILRESGDADQASVLLGRAIEFDRRSQFALPLLLQARFCQQSKSPDCARSWWQKAFERDLESLPAIAGLATLKYNAQAFAEADLMVKRGLALSPDYIPLLELRQRAETDAPGAVR